MRCDSGREDLLAGQADDAIPVVGCDAVVLRDHHRQEILRAVSGWHGVQAPVSVIPITPSEVLYTRFELLDVSVSVAEAGVH